MINSLNQFSSASQKYSFGLYLDVFYRVKKGVSDFHPRQGDASFGFHTSQSSRVE